MTNPKLDDDRRQRAPHQRRRRQRVEREAHDHHADVVDARRRTHVRKRDDLHRKCERPYERGAIHRFGRRRPTRHRVDANRKREEQHANDCNGHNLDGVEIGDLEHEHGDHQHHHDRETAGGARAVDCKEVQPVSLLLGRWKRGLDLFQQGEHRVGVYSAAANMNSAVLKKRFGRRRVPVARNTLADHTPQFGRELPRSERLF